MYKKTLSQFAFLFKAFQESVYLQWRLKHCEQSENIKTLQTNIHHYKGCFSLYNQYKLLLIDMNLTKKLASFWREN